MISHSVDEWMEQVMEQIHSSHIAAQNLVITEDPSGKVLTKTEVQVQPSKGAVWNRFSFRIDLERAFHSLIDDIGTDAKIYALFCIGVSALELAAEAHYVWPDAPITENGVRLSVLRGRGEWDIRLRRIGIYASQ
jgi:hypothetical protein